MMRLGGLVLVLLLVPVAVGQGAVKSCGDGYELFMRNPDLQPQADGRFHVSGDFFVQFQVIGANAAEIEAFAMSVGVPPENPEEICASPYWPAGTVLEAYKVDDDKEDGFHLLLNTKSQSTPQNVDLQVAVHAYDGGGQEVARFWGLGIVESCGGGVLGGCPETEQQDAMMPWPIILPGDGAKTYVPGFSIEFAEALADVQVFLNAVDITDQLQDWEGRVWDADTFYDYGPAGVFNTLAPRCTLPVGQTCVQSPGPSYQWGVRDITDDDVIRVVATDLAGNVAQKEVHVGSSVAGGTISDDAPVLTMTFVESQALIHAGGTAVFQARMENAGGGTGHPFVSADVPEGWTFEWTPGHKPVEPGTSTIQELNVDVPAGTPSGIYNVTAITEYRQGNDDRTLRSELTVLVSGSEPAGGNATGERAQAQTEESPGFGAFVLPVMALMALRKRSRR